MLSNERKSDLLWLALGAPVVMGVWLVAVQMMLEAV